MSDFKSGLVLGNEIASGFFGKVFEATDPAHGLVAVKKLHQYDGESDKAWAIRKETLLDEAQRLVLAEHANIVRVHQIVRHASDDTLYLVMEFCHGGSLQQAFETGPLSLHTARKVSSETLLGLGALHARDMLHRDIKPGNLLLDKHGAVKIGDFGLVTDDLILGYGSYAGYLNHLAPEVFENKITSMKSDVWAVAMTIYRLLHGRQWCLSNMGNTAEDVKRGGYAQRLNWLPHIPDSWRRVLRKAMHDDTTQRYQNAEQFLNAISSLECDPDWQCVVGAGHTSWERKSANRHFKVKWTEHSSKKHEWSATSYPLADGNKRNLGAAIGSKSDCLRALTNFFASA
ncbi:serine/threonine-protein kinase [Tardiphaga sp. OK245]|uniref:serine/threonine-protein kinase n=1 Tax=Tardiphaga sp. OK245 TaxID=1855306 RepID=UPI0008A80829|nr:serine/threonine-protein kinase [Tardiphaga sp. OK245]SEI03428.1 Serine/threonine protein kinase [Tardiphaga sp. OK245]